MASFDFVFEKKNIFQENSKKTKLDEEKINGLLEAINSKKERLREVSQIGYAIMKDNEITSKDEDGNPIKPQLIKQLLDFHEGFEKRKQEEMPTLEDDDDDIKLNAVKLVKRIVMAPKPNSKGNYLKSITLQTNSKNYPISPADDVDFFLKDIADQLIIMTENEKGVQLKQDNKDRVVESVDIIIPENYNVGSTPGTEKKLSANKYVDSIKKKRKETQEKVAAAKQEKGSNTRNFFGFSTGVFPFTEDNMNEELKQKKIDELLKKLKELGYNFEKEGERRDSITGGSDFSTRPELRDLRERQRFLDGLKLRRQEAENVGREYPRPDPTPLQFPFNKLKSMANNILTIPARDHTSYERWKKIENKKIDESKLKHRTLTQQELYDKLGGKKRKTRKNRKNRKNAAGGGNTFSLDPLEHLSDYYYTRGLSQEQKDKQRQLYADFRRAPSLTAIKVKRDQELYDNTRTYRPEELENRTLPNSQFVEEAKEKADAAKEAILEQRRNATVAAVEKKYKEIEDQKLYDSLGGKKRKTKKNKKKNQKRKTSKRKQKQK